MALSATFAADFSTFIAACSKAEISLKGIESGAGGVETKLTRMADSLSGTKIIQQAQLMAEAVERVGGVSTLTAKELERVGATAQEAANKLRALGQDVPPGIQKIADASAAAEGGFSKMIGTVGQLAGALGIAFGATAVIGGIKNLVAGAFDMAGAIEDATQKLGVSAEKFQGWVAAAELGGASAEDVSAAVGKMNVNLAGGSNSTVSALKAAGLEFDAIRNMAPEDAFDAIVTAIMQIPDPMERARIAVELFGKGGQTLLPAIADDMVKVGDAANKMSNETVRQLAAAGDAWQKFGNYVTIVTGNIIAAVGSTVRETTSSWAAFGKFVADAAAGGVAYALDQQAVARAIRETNTAVLALQPTLEQLTAKTHLSAEQLKAQEDAAKAAAAELARHATETEELTEIQGRMDAMYKTSTGTVGEYARKLLELGADTGDVQRVTGLTTGTIRDLKREIDAAGAASTRAAAEHKKAADEQARYAKDTQTHYAAAARYTAEYTAAVKTASGDLLGAKLADIQKWYDEELAKLLQSQGDHESYYAALDAMRELKAQKEAAAQTEATRRDTTARDSNTLLWDGYYVELAKLHHDHVMEAEIQQVKDGLTAQLDALDRSLPDWESRYDALVAIAELRQQQIAQNYHDKAIQPMIDEGVRLFGAALEGWDALKAELENIWKGILKTFEEKLVRAMVDKWLGGLAEMAAGWAGFGGGGKGGGGFWGGLLGFLGLGGGGGQGNLPGETPGPAPPGGWGPAPGEPGFIGPMPPGTPPPGAPPNLPPSEGQEPAPLPPGMPPVGTGPGTGSPTPKPVSRGGRVSASGIDYLQAGGLVWRPEGTDTVPAMLTPGERVLSVADAQRYDAALLAARGRRGGGGTVIVMLDGRLLAQAVVPELEGEIRRLGFGR